MNFKQLRCYLNEKHFIDPYLSESELIKKYIKQFPSLKILLDEIERLANTDITINFELFSTNSNIMGEAIMGRKSVTIRVFEKLENNYFESIFAHEIGEAHYLLRSLPTVNKDLIKEETLFRLPELFSHYHIQKLFQRLNIVYLHSNLDKLDADRYINYNYNKYDFDWERVLAISWGIVTYPTFRKDKDKNKHYKKYFQYIDKIMDIIFNVDTLTATSEEICKCMEEVIVILKSLDLQNVDNNIVEIPFS